MCCLCSLELGELVDVGGETLINCHVAEVIPAEKLCQGGIILLESLLGLLM